MTSPRCDPLGDAALTLSFGSDIEDRTYRRVLACTDAIAAAHLPGVTDIVPAYTTVSVFYDPLQWTYGDLRSRLEGLEAPDGTHELARAEGRVHEIPVRYDGADLATVADAVGLTTDEVVRLHSGRTYVAYVVGFVPGFAYLGRLDPRLALPRQPTPRTRVPAGSVAIADEQTAIYPLPTAGGWHLLGSTEIVLFDPARTDPALIAPGDRVHFFQV